MISSKTSVSPINPQTLAAALGGKAVGNSISAPAPGHSKRDRSLSIRVDPNAPEGFVVTAWAGEDPLAMRDYIRAKGGLPDWKPEVKSAPVAHIKLVTPKAAPKRYYDADLTGAGFHLETEYDYFDADGALSFQVVRYEHPTLGKTFRQRRPDGRDGWFGGRPDPILYRLPDLAARAAEAVYVVEGEKDVDSLFGQGLLATTVPNGSWPDDLSALKGRKIYVLSDNDATGEKKAVAAIEKLQGIATVRRVELSGLGEKGDVTDWLLAGNTVEQLESLAKAAPLVAANQNVTGPRIISSAELVRGFVPPDYHIDGIAQKGFIYSMTAATGTGKTAVLLMLAALTAEGGSISGRDIAKGRVVYFAGENPDDVTMRWIGMAEKTGFDLYDTDVHFIKDRFSVPDAITSIRAQVEILGGADLVVIDTSAAYFHGQDENGNTELGKHARDLRMLTTLPGRPCVMVACHPTKNATADNLLPRGGGAFIAEMDGNLTLAKSAGAIRLHWQGKHRGPDFEPLMIELKTITAEALKDSKGRLIPTVMAQALTNGEAVARAVTSRRDEDDVLLQIDRDASQSLAATAEVLMWRKPDNSPHKDRVRHATDKLKSDKLVEYKARKWNITPAGYEVLVGIRAERHREEMVAGSIANFTGKAVRKPGFSPHEVDAE